MKKPTKKDMQTLIEHWRSLVPGQRPLTYGELLQSAQVQAHHFRALADTDRLDINLIWLVEQTVVPINFVRSYVLGGESGLTTDEPDDILRVFINENEPFVRQRFSLLHEWKHVLDFPDHERLYRDLGQGDQEKHYTLREAVANEFAAHVLMPTHLVKELWLKTPDLLLLATLFNVSTEAIKRRLEKMGLIGDPQPRPRKYFRHIALIDTDRSTNTACVA